MENGKWQMEIDKCFYRKNDQQDGSGSARIYFPQSSNCFSA